MSATKSIGKAAAIALGESDWWESKSAREIAEFQMHTRELCLPFEHFHKAMEDALGRPVYTHEFGLDHAGLLAELMGDRKPPDLAAILALLPADKTVVVVVGDAESHS